MAGEKMDLINRDPMGINSYLGTLAFNEVLAEPDGTHSIDCVWKASRICFECWKGCCYKLNTLCCGLCIASYWGCEFASLAFFHIWCVSPEMRIFKIECDVLRRFYKLTFQCCVEPFCEAVGGIFVNLKRDN